MSRFAGGATAHSAAGSRSAFAKDSCNSRSEATRRLQYFVGPRGLRDEHGKLRNPRIPFDQRGERSKSSDRDRVQLPHFGAHVRAMIVDEHTAIVGMTGEMD